MFKSSAANRPRRPPRRGVDSGENYDLPLEANFEIGIISKLICSKARACFFMPEGNAFPEGPSEAGGPALLCGEGGGLATVHVCFSKGKMLQARVMACAPLGMYTFLLFKCANSDKTVREDVGRNRQKNEHIVSRIQTELRVYKKGRRTRGFVFGARSPRVFS